MDIEKYGNCKKYIHKPKVFQHKFFWKSEHFRNRKVFLVIVYLQERIEEEKKNKYRVAVSFVAFSCQQKEAEDAKRKAGQEISGSGFEKEQNGGK